MSSACRTFSLIPWCSRAKNIVFKTMHSVIANSNNGSLTTCNGKSGRREKQRKKFVVRIANVVHSFSSTAIHCLNNSRCWSLSGNRSNVRDVLYTKNSGTATTPRSRHSTEHICCNFCQEDHLQRKREFGQVFIIDSMPHIYNNIAAVGQLVLWMGLYFYLVQLFAINILDAIHKRCVFSVSQHSRCILWCALLSATTPASPVSYRSAACPCDTPAAVPHPNPGHRHGRRRPPNRPATTPYLQRRPRCWSWSACFRSSVGRGNAQLWPWE